MVSNDAYILNGKVPPELCRIVNYYVMLMDAQYFPLLFSIFYVRKIMFTFRMTEWIEWQLKDYYAMLPLLQQPISDPDKRVTHQKHFMHEESIHHQLAGCERLDAHFTPLK